MEAQPTQGLISHDSHGLMIMGHMCRFSVCLSFNDVGRSEWPRSSYTTRHAWMHIAATITAKMCQIMLEVRMLPAADPPGPDETLPRATGDGGGDER